MLLSKETSRDYPRFIKSMSGTTLPA